MTELLAAWRTGDSEALDRLMPVVYDELRRVARRCMSNEPPGHTLQATALVNEAYLRLVDIRQVHWQDRVHFFAMAARVMRRVLVESARAQCRLKRNGGDRAVTLDEALVVSAERGPDLVALDEALDELAEVDPRKCRVVEMRFFSGMTVEETAEVLNLSGDTVRRDWRLAKAWLYRALTSSGS